MRFLFVGGCERSGTTLVQRILCSHRRIAGGPEFVFTWRIAELFERMRADLPSEFSARLAGYYDKSELERAFRDFLGGFFGRLVERRPNALYVSEKTPSNIAAAKTLLELFPDARFVHVVRDGRDVIASHREVGRRLEAAGRADVPAMTTRRVSARWNAAAAAHFALRSAPVAANRYQLLRYEALVSEPDRVQKELFGFLGLDPEERDRASDGGPTEYVDGIWVTEEPASRGFDASRVGRWRTDLGIGARLAAGLLMGENLERLGYPVSALVAGCSRLVRRLARRGGGARRLEARAS